MLALTSRILRTWPTRRRCISHENLEAIAARAAIGSEAIEAVADRGYYRGEEIVACEQAGITVYLPKPDDIGAF